MKLSVEIFKLVEDGKKESLGHIWTDGKRVSYAPEDPILKGIVGDIVYDYSTDSPLDNEITAKGNPEKFVRMLCYRYKSPFFWATRAQEEK